MPENLKNVLLFMSSSGYLVPPSKDPSQEKLWVETWKRIDRFLPDLRADLQLEEPEPQPEPEKEKAPEPEPKTGTETETRPPVPEAQGGENNVEDEEGPEINTNGHEAGEGKDEAEAKE